jgi:FkbM family methyltransferase
VQCRLSARWYAPPVHKRRRFVGLVNDAKSGQVWDVKGGYLGNVGWSDRMKKALKALVERTLRRFGYELRKTKTYTVDGVPIAELGGLTFRDFLECYFSALNRQDFFFVQVGAHNGISNPDDVLRDYVIRFNLRGLLVEPQARVFAELQENYKGQPGLSFENAAIGHNNGSQELYTINKKLDFLSYVNQAASFNSAHLRKLLGKHVRHGAAPDVVKRIKELGLNIDDCIEAETVETYTFDSLLDKHGVRRFDLLQIDTEGFDYEVIKMANLRKFRPTLINYEHEHLSEGDQLDCWRELRTLGYRLFTHGGDTCAYQKDWKAGLANFNSGKIGMLT